MSSGIYSIRNKINGKQYIGSSKNFKKRFTMHQTVLKHNKHHSIHLQRAWNKHGSDNFEFLILEECSLELLFEREQYHIDSIDKSKLYNVGSVGGGDNTSHHPNNKEIRENIRKGVRKRYAERTEEQRKRDSEKMKGEKNPNYGNKWSDELRKEVSDIVKQRNRDNPKYSEICRNAMNKFWDEISDERYEQFCKRRTEVMLGTNNTFYGKKHTPEIRDIISQKATQRFAEMSPDEKLKLLPHSKAVIVDGVYYNSQSEAARYLSITVPLLKFRIKSKNQKFNGYNYAANGNTIAG